MAILAAGRFLRDFSPDAFTPTQSLSGFRFYLLCGLSTHEKLALASLKGVDWLAIIVLFGSLGMFILLFWLLRGPLLFLGGMELGHWACSLNIVVCQ